MNPPLTHKKRRAKDERSYPSPYDHENKSSYDSLLLHHRVPSASLYLEEMLAQWPVASPGQPFHDEQESLDQDTKRSSVATYVEFGEWISRQSRDRPASLLPPVPQMIRLPSSDTGKVECRLSSPSPRTPPKVRVRSSTIENQEQLRGLSAQLQEVSFITKTTVSPPTRPITPVPSLTASNYSQSSSSHPGISPPTTIGSVRHQLFGSPLDPINSTRKGIITGQQRFRNTGTLLPSPPIHQDARLDWGALPANPPRAPTNFASQQPTVNTAFDVTVVHLPQYPELEEVSYIEWDDDEEDVKPFDSALHRIKKSFTDLRAAERYILDASIRSKPQHGRGTATATAQGHRRPTAGVPHTISRTGSTFNPLLTLTATTPEPKAERFSLSTAARLRKKGANTKKRRASEVRNSRVMAPAATSPPSTGKRKRSNTVNSQRCSREMQTKKAKADGMGNLVRRLLGGKKAR